VEDVIALPLLLVTQLLLVVLLLALWVACGVTPVRVRAPQRDCSGGRWGASKGASNGGRLAVCPRRILGAAVGTGNGDTLKAKAGAGSAGFTGSGSSISLGLDLPRASVEFHGGSAARPALGAQILRGRLRGPSLGVLRWEGAGGLREVMESRPGVRRGTAAGPGAALASMLLRPAGV